MMTGILSYCDVLMFQGKVEYTRTCFDKHIKNSTRCKDRSAEEFKMRAL